MSHPPPGFTGDEFYDDRLELVELLGTGNVTVVYRALTNVQEWPATVAVKLPAVPDEPSGQLDIQTARRALAHEGRLWARVDDHPNVGTVFENSSLPRPSIIAEFVGDSLADRVETFDRATRMDILDGVCDAVQFAHEQGIVHGDLTLDNVLIASMPDAQPQPKLVDWGVAETFEDSRPVVRGYTPRYTAPEQVNSKGDRPVTIRTDVYQLGVVAYRLTTGYFPFDYEEEPALREAIREVEPPAPARIADVSEERSQAIQTALAKSPADRFERVDQFTRALRTCRDESPVSMSDSSHRPRRVICYEPTDAAKSLNQIARLLKIEFGSTLGIYRRMGTADTGSGAVSDSSIDNRTLCQRCGADLTDLSHRQLDYCPDCGSKLAAKTTRDPKSQQANGSPADLDSEPATDITEESRSRRDDEWSDTSIYTVTEETTRDDAVRFTAETSAKETDRAPTEVCPPGCAEADRPAVVVVLDNQDAYAITLDTPRDVQRNELIDAVTSTFEKHGYTGQTLSDEELKKMLDSQVLATIELHT